MVQHPVVAVTAGDPCGIGPEVLLKAFRSFRRPSHLQIVVIGDHRVCAEAAKRLGVRLPSWRITPHPELNARDSRFLFWDVPSSRPFRPGRSGRAAGEAAAHYLDRALALWRAKRLSALVTAPVTKWAVEQARGHFEGHTEYLAQAMRARDVTMMFVSDHLRVALLSRHVALRDVPAAVNRRVATATLRQCAQALSDWFAIRRPRLAVCGLNPHAGEAGAFGREEREVLLPAMRALRRQGVICDGPFAADGFFASLLAARPPRRSYDAIICAYHDQGLIPFKMAARDSGCQLTVGLPIIRTSPDHGSALDIAGRGVANSGSMRYALDLAVRLASRSA